MPRKRQPARRPRRRVRRARLKRNPQQTSGNIRTKQYARCVEVVPFTQPTANTDVNYQFNISQFDRAKEIAKNFKFYRAKRVVWTMLPEYNVFQSGAGQVSLPTIAVIMNRTGDNTAWTQAEYDAQGAVPKTFSKKRLIAYKPNLVQPFNVAINVTTLGLPTTGTVGNTPVYDKWIGTGSYLVDNPNVGTGVGLSIRGDVTPYYGHAIYWAATSTAPNEPALATIFCEVEWEFKDPLFDLSPGVDLPANVAKPLER